MDMLEMPVRLVVKAPNQQIEDQMVDCALNWTVQRLKAYLAESYPSKPKAEEQKLIYSGQLLPDHLTLKEVLRQYDKEQVHTVHLVCIPLNDYHKPESKPAKTKSLQDVDSEGQSGAISNDESDLLRRRRNAGVNAAPQTGTTSHTSVGTAEERINQYNLYVEQTRQAYTQYMNYYYTLQFQMAQNPLTAADAAVPSSSNTVVNQVTPETPAREQDDDRESDRQQPPPPANNNGMNVRMNAQGGPVDDDDDEVIVANWDWLDWVYGLSRVAILLSIVYFYSSFNRFVAVLFFAAIVYLYQVGWMQPRRRRQMAEQHLRRPIPVPAPPAPDPAEAEQDADREAAEQMRQETREIEEMMNRDLPAAEGVVNRASFVNIAWTFIATFFSSLFPEHPAPVNFN